MQFPIRLVSLLLVLALLWGLSAPIGATGANEAEISFVQVDNSAVSANLLEQQAETHAESSHASTDMVRVSIVLEKKSVLEAGFPATVLPWLTGPIWLRSRAVCKSGLSASPERNWT